ncbi:MAG TPA: GNAT family N-acetyltransferase [Mycobacteriales bacterium]|nr:GNAT family N-acetyltransferase [Mycobacteriales bacterium]
MTEPRLRGSRPADDAAAAASHVALQAGVTIRQLHDLAAMQDVTDLFVDVWQTRRMDPPVNRDLLRALSHAGAYVAAAYAGDEVVGGSVGLFSADGSLHSHISGVRSGLQGRSVGWALKLDQRAWCLDRGITTVTWTFDPLVRRNAWFNLSKLGATCDEYLPDFYGSMRDGVNVGDASDRLYARWDLLSWRTVDAAAGRLDEIDSDVVRESGAQILLDEVDGRPVARERYAAGSAALLVATPADIVDLRGRDLPLAAEWRQAVRDALGTVMSDDYRATGMTRSGYYVLTPKDDPS